MKVPVLDNRPAPTKPIGTSYQSGTPSNFSQTMGKGLGDLAQGAGQLGDAIDKEAKLAAQKAEDEETTSGITEWQHEDNGVEIGDSGTPGTKAEAAFQGMGEGSAPRGFMFSRGKAAARDSGIVLEHLAKKRQEIEDRMTTDRAKQNFRLRSGGLYEDARRRIESHVARQSRVAEEDALEGNRQEALKSIGNNYSDGITVARQAASLEGPIRAFQTSKEDGDAKVEAWRAEVLTTVLDQAIASGDYEFAEEQFNAAKDRLPPKAAAGYEKKIEAIRLDRQADHAADLLARDSRLPNGKFDAEKAYGRLEEMKDPSLKDPVRERLKKREMIEDQIWKDKVREVGRKSQALYNIGKFSFESPLALELNELDPEKYASLKRAQEMKYRRHKAGRSGNGTAEQLDALIRLKAEMEEDPQKFEDMDFEEFKAEYRDLLSDPGFKEAGGIYAHKQKDAKERPAASAAFNRYVGEEVGSNPMLRKSKDKAGKFRALMGDQWRAWTQKNKGDPTPEDLEAMREAVWTKKSTWLGLGSENVLKEREPVTSGGMVTVTRKSDGKSRQLTREQAAKFQNDSNFEVR